MIKNYKIERRNLPLIPIRGIGIFPNTVIHFDIGREKSINALEEAMLEDSDIFLTVQKVADMESPKEDDFYEVGVICKIKQMIKMPGDNIRVLVEGINRAKIVSVTQDDPYFEVALDEYIYDDSLPIDDNLEAMVRLTLNNFEEYALIYAKIAPDAVISLKEIKNPDKLADVVASYIYLKTNQKQALLEIFDPYKRLESINKMLAKEIKVLQIENEINELVKKQVSEFQKDYYLKEQMRAIQKELGEDEGTDYEVEEYLQKISKANMPKDVKEKAEKEINRLLKISPSSPDAGVIRTYVDWLLDLPWNKKTKDNTDLSRARKILAEDHYGLEEVKERILEYLAVKNIKKDMKGPILCFVGPPGVGKTSIAKSIARAMDRKYVRISLGGVRDEAEIRGHRRTYIGAIPGRIISSIAKVKVNNPVFLLDEIDKLNSDFKGDPASALLEALDPEQNNTFTDHYIEAPFSLQNVMFITTANTTSTIPGPLLDRMEVIEISGYTDIEKRNIAEKYLIKKQLSEHGLKENQVKISTNAINEIIERYTRESGVRNLERNIGKLIRKAAVQIVEKNKSTVSINNLNIKKYLGIPKYDYDIAYEEDQVGVVTGLAWTQVGGETLFVEVNTMKGDGKLQLTGQLGDVMKESAMAALSYIKANAENFDIDNKIFKETDIHVHVPEGAIPKDGPSAGITMATAIISALTKKPVRKDVAMTGEITITGRVLPIGGLKEKLLAAKRAGIKKVLLCSKNKADVSKIDPKIIRSMEIVYADKIDDVVKEALR
ncbi:MAG TPA: endopeptidase La [Sedimentibacter sp.]|jgi:ATP-dependent Lon protease|nr:endopeptidase La [Tissierellia bacterium]HAS92483.1 endopeptidase La [Clostridiales bacterium]HOG62028.1 endopeptidase La [Sedimentibacter sp.]HOT21164.1 endopeptidase La [Sedimentibacter sp.]HPB78747.1 endopeptidase La [Sedimentibacter sp.]